MEAGRSHPFVWADRYRCRRLLGEGGMATVHLARDEELGRDVAVKIMRPALADDGTSRERFLREARMAAGLDHPSILPVYTADVWEDLPYLVMRHVSGGNLRRLLGRGVGPAALLEIMASVADGLAEAHEKGVLHRDLKPENVLLDETGRALVADWGLARSIAEDRGLTRTGRLVGTPGYMAPEQIRGELLGPPCDVHALGVMLYEAVAGQRPFRGATPLEIVTARLEEDPVPVERLVPSLHPPLAHLVMDCLSRDPADRPADAGEIATRLRAWAHGAGGTSRRRRAAVAPAPTVEPSAVGSSAVATVVGAAGGGSPGRTRPSVTPDPDSPVRPDRPARRRLPAFIGVACLLLALALVFLAPRRGDRGGGRGEGEGGRSGRSPLLRLRAQELLAPGRLRLRVSGWTGGKLRVDFEATGSVPLPTPQELTLADARKVSREVLELDVLLAPPLATEGRLVLTELVTGRRVRADVELSARRFWTASLAQLERMDEGRLVAVMRDLEAMRLSQRGLDISSATTPSGRELARRLGLVLEGAGFDLEGLRALGAVMPLLVGSPARADVPFALRLSACLAMEAQLSTEPSYRPPWGRAAGVMGIRFRRGRQGDPFVELPVLAEKELVTRVDGRPRWLWVADGSYVASMAASIPTRAVARQLLLKMLRSKGWDPDAEILPEGPEDFVHGVDWVLPAAAFTGLPADGRIFVEIICRFFSRRQRMSLRIDVGPEIVLFNCADMDPGYGGNSPMREQHVLVPLAPPLPGGTSHRIVLRMRALAGTAMVHPVAFKTLRLRRASR